MTDLKEKIRAIIILHAAGDTIGFRNGKWEFFGATEFARTRKINFDLANELLYEFIALGGINNINLEKWYVSDDTLLHMDVIDAYLEDIDKDKDKILDKNINKIKELLIKKFIKTKQIYFDNRVNINRLPGITTVKSIDELEKGIDNIPYNSMAGGNGAAMRAPILGILYYNNIDKLIESSIILSKITHNSAIGYLGAVNTAYFVALGIKNINLHKWPYMLLELLDSQQVRKYIDKNNEQEKNDYNIFVNKWKKYVEMRFDKDKNPGFRRSYMNLSYRIQFYYDNFVDPNIGIIPGASGYLVNIMAYDALLDAESSWEKLVVYSMLHLGDTDTVGCIAASFYGSLYGFGCVPKNNIMHLEFKDKLDKQSNKLIDIINL